MRNWLKKLRGRLSPESLEGPIMVAGQLGLIGAAVGFVMAARSLPWGLAIAVGGLVLFIIAGKLTERGSLSLHRLLGR